MNKTQVVAQDSNLIERPTLATRVNHDNVKNSCELRVSEWFTLFPV